MSAWSMRAGRATQGRWLVPVALISSAAGLALSGPAAQAALAVSRPAAPIAAGSVHSCVIESGKAYCWGYNLDGELGDDSTVNSSVPVAVSTRGALAGKVLTQISALGGHTCALDTAGAAYCWGYNLQGELGDGSTVNSSVPVAVSTRGALAGKVLTQITAGIAHTCALDRTGAAYCWGENDHGELGDGGTADSDVPVAVATHGALAGKTVAQISAGGYHTCAVAAAGAGYCWGWNQYGQLGNGSVTDSSVPVAVDTSGALRGRALIQIAAGENDTCVVAAAASAYCWGWNGDGNLGDGNTADSSVPVAVDTSGALASQPLTQVTVGDEQACGVDTAGAGYCWGDNADGQLGDGSTANSSVPVAVYARGVLRGKALTQVAAGGDHTCARDAAGAAYCWGQNFFGELGDNTTRGSKRPVLAGPKAPSRVRAVSGDSSATVSWAAPARLDGGTLTGYTATASPGGAECTTAGLTTCVIARLRNGTSYRVTVVAHTTAGDSGASAPASVLPASEPAFTSRPAVRAAAGVSFSFTVTTTGAPAPTITRNGPLPPGISFADNGDGTATISGISWVAVTRSYALTLTARNHAGTATQAFTLTITGLFRPISPARPAAPRRWPGRLGRRTRSPVPRP